MDWKDWIALILGAAVFVVTGGFLLCNIHKLKAECKEDMRKRKEAGGRIQETEKG